MRASQPSLLHRVPLRRAGELAKGVGLVLVAVVLLFSAVFLLLAVTSWAADRDTGTSSSARF